MIKLISIAIIVMGVYAISQLCSLILKPDAYMKSKEHQEFTKARQKRIERRMIENANHTDL